MKEISGSKEKPMVWAPLRGRVSWLANRFQGSPGVLVMVKMGKRSTDVVLSERLRRMLQTKRLNKPRSN
jgi:hypothetical protein